MTGEKKQARVTLVDAQRMMALFDGARANGYMPATMRRCDDGKMRPEAHRWLNKRPTVALWRQHLAGTLGLGILPPDQNGRIVFGALDVDDYSLNLLETAEQIHRQKLPLVPVHTKSGGQHLFLFATEPVEEELMKRALRALAVRLGLELKEARGKTEIITTANIWMPYCGGGEIGNTKCYAVRRHGGAMTVGEFLGDADAKRQSPEAIAELARPPANAATNGTDGASYAERRLRRYCAELGEMADGEGRNDFLNKALFAMGTMIRSGWIARAKVENELKQTADASGMDSGKTEDLIRRRNSPIDQGMKKPPPNISERAAPNLVRVADVPPQPVVWLWRGRIARGKLTMIGGHPGVSKSTLTIDMAARVTKGMPWPCGEGAAPQGSVIMVTSEDDVADTIRPRLAAAGADVERVYVLKGMRTNGGGRRGFDLTTDIEALETTARKIGDVVLIIIDPVTAYMGKPGKIDSYRVTDVRAMLEPLQDMVARCGAAVVGINHLSKGGSNEALMRFLGSVGMVATSRASFLVARDNENPARRLFLPAKNNLGDDRTGFAFKVQLKSTGYTEPLPPFEVAVEWESETVNMTADEALAAERGETDGRKSESAETAKKLISELLRDGPRPAAEIEKRAGELAISARSMRTAKQALGVRSVARNERRGGWVWCLPGSTPAQSELDLDKNVI